MEGRAVLGDSLSLGRVHGKRLSAEEARGEQGVELLWSPVPVNSCVSAVEQCNCIQRVYCGWVEVGMAQEVEREGREGEGGGRGEGAKGREEGPRSTAYHHSIMQKREAKCGPGNSSRV